MTDKTAKSNDLRHLVRQAQIDAAETVYRLFKRQARAWLRMDYHDMRESMAKFGGENNENNTLSNSSDHG